MWDLVDTDLQVTIINMLKGNMFKGLMETMIREIKGGYDDNATSNRAYQ